MKVHLPIKNFGKQQSIFDSPARHKVVAKGRRFGLTKGASNNFIKMGMERGFKSGLWIDTVNTNIDRYIERYFGPIFSILPDRYWSWRKQDKIVTIRHSVIDFRSADRPENIEGFGYDRYFINEAGIVLKNEYLYHNAIRPMLWDYEASGVIGGCVKEDTFVLSDGIKCIGAFSNERRDNKYSSIKADLIGFGKNRATDFYSNGVVNTITIETKGGYSLVGTPNHKIWTTKGWMQLKDITKNDEIGIFYGQQEWGNDKPKFIYKTNKHYRNLKPELNEKTAYLIGYFLGDGNLQKKRITVNFHFNDKQLIDFLIDFGFKFSPKRNEQMRLNSREYVEFIKILGFIPNLAINKTLPLEILKCNKTIISAFLRGLFDADGCARKTGNVTFASTSKKLIQQIMIVLLNYGIISSCSKGFAPAHVSKQIGYVKESTLYTIHLNKYNSKLFGKEIGFFLDRKQKNITKSNTDRYLTGYKKNGVFWTKIKNKTFSKSYTCDFVIPNTHSYISNGFMSHNTPKGKGLFYELYNRGLDKDQPRYQSSRFSTFDNPFLNHQDILEEMRSMPEKVVRQEIYAEFLEDTGVVFTDVNEITILKPQEPVREHLYVVGCDLAKVEDYTVLTVYSRKTNNQVFQMRFNKLEWPYQKERIKEVSRKFNNALVYLDATGVGDPIADDLLRAGVPVEPIHLTNELKKQIIEKLANWIELKYCYMLDLDETRQEFNSFTYDISSTGKIRYEAPAGFKDDIVLSHGLAIWGLQPIPLAVKEEKKTIVARDVEEKIKGMSEDVDVMDIIEV